MEAKEEDLIGMAVEEGTPHQFSEKTRLPTVLGDKHRTCGSEYDNSLQAKEINILHMRVSEISQ